MIKYKTIQKILRSERFSVNFLIIGIFVSLFFIIAITICSGIQRGSFTYGDLENLVTYYDFPIKIMAVTLTIFGILIVYHSYFQSKEQFIKENRPWIAMGNIYIKKINNQTHLYLDFINFGNTPASRFRSNILSEINNKKITIKELIKSEITIFPNKVIALYTPIKKSDIKNDNPIVKITSDISYYGIDENIKTTKGEYEYNFDTEQMANFGEICT